MVMMQSNWRPWAGTLAMCWLGAVQAATGFKNLHTFAGPPDGSSSLGDLVAGSDGMFYGTTQYGGTGGCGTLGCGTVFSLKRNGELKIIHSFQRIPTDGAVPRAGLMLGADGNFYGTTYSGGAFNSGTLYRVTPKGKLTLLHSFGADEFDGRQPASVPVQTPDGAIWGTTIDGGTGTGPICTNAGGDNCGTVFRYHESTGLAIAHSFSGEYDDGAFPNAGLMLASDGRLYGPFSIWI